MISTGRCPGTIGKVVTPIWRPSWASCSCAAGRCTSSEAISTFLRSRFFSRSAILAQVVVLPEPCSPTSMIADRRGRVQVDAVAPSASRRRRLAAEHLDEMIVHDLDDHLPRRHRAQHLLADRLLAHRIDEIAHDRQRDIGFEQRDADLAHRARDIVLAQRAVPAQPVEDIVQAIAEGVEHG